MAFLLSASEVVDGKVGVVYNVPILGLYQTEGQEGGRVAVYGDSNCLDSAHMTRGEFVSVVCAYVCLFEGVCAYVRVLCVPM